MHMHQVARECILESGVPPRTICAHPSLKPSSTPPYIFLRSRVKYLFIPVGPYHQIRRRCLLSSLLHRLGVVSTHLRRETMKTDDRALKVVVCGPVKGGKTSIANFLAGQTEHIGNANKIYEATVGVRQGLGFGFVPAYLEVNRRVARAMYTCFIPKQSCECVACYAVIPLAE